MSSYLHAYLVGLQSYARHAVTTGVESPSSRVSLKNTVTAPLDMNTVTENCRSYNNIYICLYICKALPAFEEFKKNVDFDGSHTCIYTEGRYS